MRSTNVRENNKGFSLVELIVVMAIMAILAVTLAPRLTHYVEKSRQVSDREVVNTIYSATKLSLTDEAFLKGFKSLATADDTTTPTKYTLTLNTNPDDLYVIASNKWTADTTETNAFFTELRKVIGPSFTLKSSKAGDGTQITIDYTLATEAVTVALDYSGSTPSEADGDYSVTDAN